MSPRKKSKKPQSKNKPEILSPEDAGNPSSGDVIFQTLIQHLPENPVEIIEVLEKYNPGFTKHMIKETEEFNKKARYLRFIFGKWQAYITLALKSICVVGAVLAIFLAIYQNAGFLYIIALAIFLAVAQGGSPVWRAIAEAIAARINPK